MRRPLRECFRRSSRSIARRSGVGVEVSGTWTDHATGTPLKIHNDGIAFPRIAEVVTVLVRDVSCGAADCGAPELHVHQRVAIGSMFLRCGVDARWISPCKNGGDDIVAGVNTHLARVRYASEFAYLSRAAPALTSMPDNRIKPDSRMKNVRRAGRPPAGAREGEKVKDYPQLSIRVPVEMKARLNALSAVTGLAQWRVIVEAIDCFLHDLPPTDRALVDGLSQRLLRAG